jgi:hypothetical protein
MNLTAIAPDLRKAFANLRLYTDARPYSIVSLPRDQMRAATILFGGLADPFAAMIVDKDEITIVMHEMDWSLGGRGLANVRVEADYRLITFDLELDLDTVGFMALVGRVLAEAGIALLPIGAYSRDHILVRGRDAERAWMALGDFIAACKAGV